MGFSEKYLNVMKDKSPKPINARVAWCPATADGSNLALLALYYVSFIYNCGCNVSRKFISEQHG